MSWDFLDDAILNEGVVIDDNWLSIDEIKRNDPNILSFCKIKTVREIPLEINRLTYTRDGDFTITREYDIFPPELIDGQPLLNAYAQLAYNTFARDNNYESPFSLGSDPRKQEINNEK